VDTVEEFGVEVDEVVEAVEEAGVMEVVVVVEVKGIEEFDAAEVEFEVNKDI